MPLFNHLIGVFPLGWGQTSRPPGLHSFGLFLVDWWCQYISADYKSILQTCNLRGHTALETEMRMKSHSALGLQAPESEYRWGNNKGKGCGMTWRQISTVLWTDSRNEYVFSLCLHPLFLHTWVWQWIHYYSDLQPGVDFKSCRLYLADRLQPPLYVYCCRQLAYCCLPTLLHSSQHSCT